MKEQGYDLSFSNWNAWFMPKDTPREVVEKLVGVCRTAVQNSAVREGMEKMQTPIAYLGQAEFGATAQKEYASNKGLVEAVGLTKQD